MLIIWHRKDPNHPSTLIQDFVKDLKINSANLVDVILDVEDAFDIRIENNEMEKMLSVKAAMDIVNGKLSAK